MTKWVPLGTKVIPQKNVSMTMSQVVGAASCGLAKGLPPAQHDDEILSVQVETDIGIKQ